MVARPFCCPKQGERQGGMKEVRSYRFVILGLMVLVQVSFSLNFFAVSPLFPLIREEWGLGRATVSLLVALVVLMMALFNLPASLLAARIGLKRAYTLGALLLSAGILTPLASSFPMLILLRLVFGLGVATVAPLGGAIIMGWVRPQRLPLMNSLNIVAQSLAMAISLFTIVPLARALGWQNALALLGAVSLAIALGWAFLGEVKGQATGALPLKELAPLARQRTTLLLGLGLAGSFSFYTSMSSWLPTFYHEDRGMSLERAGQVVGLLPFLGIAGSLLGGFLAARTGRRRPFLMASAILMMATGLGSFLLPNPALIYLVVAIMGIGSWLYLPSAFTIPMELPGMTPQKVGVVLASSLGIGNLAAFLSPLLVGIITDATGSYAPGFALLSVMALFLGLAGFLLPETGRAPAPRAQDALAGADPPPQSTKRKRRDLSS